MGVDYDPSGGVGVFIKRQETIDLNPDWFDDEDSCFDEFLDRELAASNFSYLLYGNSYSGDVEYLVVLDKNTLFSEVTSELKRLEKYLKEHNIVHEPINWEKALKIKDCVIIESIIW